MPLAFTSQCPRRCWLGILQLAQLPHQVNYRDYRIGNYVTVLRRQTD